MTYPDHDSGDATGAARRSLSQLGRGGPQTVLVKVEHESDIGGARRAAARIADDVGMSESEAGALALVVTETATNIARHARRGFIVLRFEGSSEDALVEMVGVDSGPGIADLARAFADGFSTGGTAGKGLGAMKRMSHQFDIWSLAGGGTAIVARFPLAKHGISSRRRIGVVCTPVAGETACGDAWMVEPVRDGTLIALVDGLGHGPDAAVAADTAISVIQRRKTSSLSDIIQAAHGALRSTRGAAVQLAIADMRSKTVRSVAVGNISASCITHGGSKSIPSQPGIVGMQMPHVREVTIPWSGDSLLVMHSDGISTRWKLDSYPGLRLRDPALAAAVLFRDFARAHDDATIITFREAGDT